MAEKKILGFSFSINPRYSVVLLTHLLNIRPAFGISHTGPTQGYQYGRYFDSV